jgi:glucokinase
MILAGDVGGTKTLLALVDEPGDVRQPMAETTYPSREHPSLEDVVSRFLATHPGARPCAACLGVPGLVTDGRCKATNLPWETDERRLAAVTGIGRVKLLNDVEAAALGMLTLRPDELVALNPTAAAGGPGHVAVIAAGTGLGEAILAWDGVQHHPVASEGGHTDFAPRTDEEIALLRHLRDQVGHVSWERVAAGSAIHTLYEFLRERGGGEPEWLRAALAAASDRNAVITDAALAGTSALSVATLDWFATLLGAAAGNLALTCLSTGGVYVGGGMAPKILPVLANGSFMRGFTAKGRFQSFLESLPVFVALEPRAPLFGAAAYARRL